MAGAPVTQLRANVILRANWFDGLMLQMEAMDVTDLWKLEYVNDQDMLAFGQPKRKTIKEVPFIKNNPRALEGAQKEED